MYYNKAQIQKTKNMKKIILMLLIGFLSIITSNVGAQGTKSSQLIRVYLKDSINSQSKIGLLADYCSIDAKIYRLNMKVKATAVLGKYEIMDFFVKSVPKFIQRYRPFILVETEKGDVFFVENNEKSSLKYVPMIKYSDKGMMMDGEHKINLSEDIMYGNWYIVTGAVLQDFAISFMIQYQK